jgi:hypothetical protein
MLNQPDIRDSLILRKLIIVSMCEIFKDIVPSYKIRGWTEKEKDQNVNNIFYTAAIFFTKSKFYFYKIKLQFI